MSPTPPCRSIDVCDCLGTEQNETRILPRCTRATRFMYVCMSDRPILDLWWDGGRALRYTGDINNLWGQSINEWDSRDRVTMPRGMRSMM